MPADWQLYMVHASTYSDGDGGGRPSQEVLQAASDAEVYFGFGLSQELFAAAKGLRWVHSAAAGVTALLFPGMKASPVMLTNSAGTMGETIAEHVLGGVIYLVRSLDVAVDLHRAGRWDKEPFVGPAARVRELSECRALIVGTGGIGAGVARRFAACNVACTGVRRRPDLPGPPGFSRIVGFDRFEAELPSADILVLAAPLTPDTRGLMDARRLDCLPREAIVVNVARGSLLDEDALAERVASGALRGAVLDVFHEEPLSPASPFWKLPQILLTPHVAAVSPRRFWERELSLFIDNWGRYRAGEPLKNLVDKEAGY
jgi:phosphoglycerate dehydrogenase-like enzyme